MRSLVLIFNVIFIIGLFEGALTDAKSAPNNRLVLQKARSEFAQKKYDRAIILYKKHLRSSPKDYEVWDQLAAAYYHTGLAFQALKILKKNSRRTNQISYNLFYQGLCYDSLNKFSFAASYYKKASRYRDVFAERALFELALLYYQKKSINLARNYLTQYQTRFPSGTSRTDVEKMLKSLKSGHLIADVKGTDKPDLEKALYKYNWRSLHETPHFWFFRTGFGLLDGIQADPAPDQASGIKTQKFQSQELHLAGGGGIGPLESKGVRSWIGYNYRQKWITSPERINTYLEDFTDVSYFPFRPDLLERSHQIYGDAGKNFGRNFFLGIFAQLEFKRIGSSLFRGPDEVEVQSRSENVSQTSLVIPRVGFNYLQNYQTLFYLYLRKELNDEGPEFSNKSYGVNDQAISYGISQRMAFPNINLRSTIDLFQFEYIYNDQWLDFSRLGIVGGLQYDFLYGIELEALLGYVEDQYLVFPLKQGSCSSFKRGSGFSAGSVAPTRCPRKDTGTLYGIGANWNISDFEQISLKYNWVENKNSDQEVYNKTESNFLISLTMAFPSVKRVLRFTERFAEIAFVKNQE